MNTDIINSILANTQITKTERIRQLLALGLTRRQVTDLTGGNYGFVQNVFAKYFPNQVNVRQTSPLVFVPTAFNRKFGIEIEAFGVPMSRVAQALRVAGIVVETEGYNHVTRRHWKLVTDGSLNGENTFELVSPVLEGEAGLNELNKVSEVLVGLRVKINKTCGMHVHFDASDLTTEAVKNLMLNYGDLEGVINSFLPESRRNNSYCLSLKTETMKAKINAATSIRKLAESVNSRYYRINLQAYLRHGTVEFRQHSGTIEFRKMKNWIVFLHNLVEFSKSRRVQTVNNEVISQFCQPEIVEYFHLRQQELAA